MKCKEAQKYISALIDEEIDIDIKDDLLEHINQCEECKKIYEEEKEIKALLKDQLVDLPDGFTEEFHDNLNKMKADGEKTKRGKVLKFTTKYRKVLSIAAVFILGIVLVTTSMDNLRMGSNKSMDVASQEMATENFTADSSNGASPKTAMVEGEAKSATSTFGVASDETMKSEEYASDEQSIASTEVESSQYKTGRLIIKNGYINLSVLEFDQVVEDITMFAKENEGYISSLNEYSNPTTELKNGNLIVKIDSNVFDLFVDYLKTLGKVTNISVDSRDITNQYRDTVSRIENLEITQNRLRAILEKSKTVEDTLKIERELSRVRVQLEGLKGQIKNWERLADLSTIEIRLKEVETLEVKIREVDQNIFQKSKEGFLDSINMLITVFEVSFITLVSYFPIIISISIIVGLAYLIIRKIMR